MTELNLGMVNGHVVGRVLKETVRRAMVTIYGERAAFEAQSKLSYGGTMDDVFTSADTKAQGIYLRTFEECFPLAGVIGEEDSLRIEPQGGSDAYFTVDPLDGTKAYVRRQSHGVSTMVALVVGGEVVAAYIGDVNADEVYGYRPDSDRVFRITHLDTFEELDPNPAAAEQPFALIRDPEKEYSAVTRGLLQRCKSYEVMGSSIGTWMARLWKREVTMAILRDGFETPWDSTPVIGISKKLGYLFFRPRGEGFGWEQIDPALPLVPVQRAHDLLVIHRNDAVALGFIPA